MTILFGMVGALCVLTLLSAILADRRVAIAITVIGLITLWTQMQGLAGVPAGADSRLAAEPFKVLSVAQVSQDGFLIGVKFPNGDIRSYLLSLPEPDQKDKFLKAQQSIKRGIGIVGRARHPRAGQASDGGMDFGFSTPESEAK